MALFNVKQPTGIETKSYLPEQSFAEFLFSSGNGDIGSYEAIRLYYQCKPFFHAIKKRSGGFAQIQPRVFDTELKEFVDDHPILKKLKNPNPFQSYAAFASEMAECFDVTGNTFPIATGNVKYAPIELYNEKPQCISMQDGKNSYYYPNVISVSTKNDARNYRLEDVKVDGITTARYYTPDRLGEIWQTKDTNLGYQLSGMWGMSRAQPIWLEIQQFVEANNNNLSILRRGGRPSLGWSWTGDAPMTDAQFVRAREELKKYTGASNAGRQAIVDKLKPEAIGQTMRDMEFSVNRETVQKDIYVTYDVPLAFMSTAAMTLDNLKVSEFLMWRDSILPLASFLFGELSRFLLPRYGNIGNHKVENMRITFNPFDIEVLRRQRIADTLELSKINIMTDNEMRTGLGYEDLIDGGDNVWKPSTYIPAELDADTSDNLKRPLKSLSKNDEFINDLRDMKRRDGTPLFDNAELDKYRKVT